MKIALLQSNYLPWKGNFDLIRSVDAYIVYDEVQYTKNDWRNRNRIKDHQGNLQWLTIPVSVKSSGQTIAETAIAQANWPEKHWRTLAQNYAKAPHFKAFSDQIETLYQTSPRKWLTEANQHFLRGLCELLGLSTPILNSIDYDLQGDRQQRIIDLCQKLGADQYLSGPAARDYLDPALFKAAGIEVEWMSYQGYPTYPQGKGPFTHYVTILDLLFNTGPSFQDYLKPQ